jgi:hypothetical protein
MVRTTFMQELNPRYDMSLHTHNPYGSIDDALKDRCLFIVNTAKSLERGACIGALVGTTLGTIYSIVSESDVSVGARDGAITGAIMGMMLDFSQYHVRYVVREAILVYRKIRADISQNKNDTPHY